MTRTRRQSRRLSDFADARDDSEEVPTAPASSSPSVPIDTVTEMMAALQRSQTEALERLFDRVLSPHTHPLLSPASVTASTSSQQLHSGNFSKCTARFRGAPEESVECFIDAIEAYKECANINEENCLRGLSMLLTQDAAIWWQGVKESTLSWEAALIGLQGAFGDTRPPHKIYKQIFAMPQKQGEKTERFVAKVRSLLARIPRGDLTEKVEIDMIYGLLHKRIRKRLRRDEAPSFKIMLEKAREIEDAFEDDEREQSIRQPLTTKREERMSPQRSVRIARERSPPTGQRPRLRSPPPPPPVQQARHRSPTPARQSRPRSPPSPTPSARSAASVRNPVNRRSAYFEKSPNSEHATRSAPTTTTKSFCIYCKRRGHLRDQCLKLKAASNNNNSDNNTKCYKCGQNGFTFSQCPNCNGEFLSLHAGATSNEHGNKHKNNCEYYPSDFKHFLENFNSRVTTNFYDRDNSDLFYTIPSLSPLMKFGHDGGKCEQGTNRNERPILKINILGTSGKALLDTGAKSSILGSEMYRVIKHKNHLCWPVTTRIKLADGSVQPREVLTTDLEVHVEGHRSVTLKFIIFPDAHSNETLLGMDFISSTKLLLDFESSTFKFSDSDRTHPLEYESPKPFAMVSAADFVRKDEGRMLCSKERQALADLLFQNQDIFEAGGDPTPYAEHHIDTGDHQPISVPPYRLTPAKKDLMKAELDKMLQDGVIEECESAWTSPAILVPKKDGTVRFCVDYRKLNAITKTDHYPLPLIDDLLQSTKRDCFMSTCDLKSGYWQVKVSPEDQDKTAFVTPFGTFRFKRMPFGLKNAPSTFQRLMDRFRSGSSLQDVTLLGYLDDLMIITQGTFEDHLRDLQKVFDRLRHFGLRANRGKCFFARQEVNYLGHVITPKGIRPDYSKVDAILQMKEPGNVKHLKSFLQTCSWFRKFIKDFSKTAEPLTKLTRKNEVWRWTAEQQQAFEALKTKLCESPILIQADYSKPFLLRTDASNYAIGAALLQDDGKDEKPIEYASRLLTSAEKNYSTTEREALAVVWAVEKFRGYIDGHSCIVKSDHQPLKWLFTLKTPTGRLIRWALKLQSFDLHIEYAPGKINVLADTLSRPPCEDDAHCSMLCSVIVDIPQATATKLRIEQLEDPEVLKIIRDLEGSDELSSNRWLERGYIMTQGVLYRYDPDGSTEEAQLVVPSSKREEILKELHDAPTAGHQGIERTLNRLRERYYFPGMRRYVSEYLKNCIDCQRYKSSNQKPPGLLQTPILQQRSEVLAVDLFGPLPEGDLGERWILLVEDVATRWVELFPLSEATAENCSRILIEEYFLRYGLPRRVISDNGSQFISAVMQQCMNVLGIKQELIPVYHPEANPAERKNRDLKVQLSMLVKTEHKSWPKYLAHVRFSMNSAICSTTGKTPAYLTFAREMRTLFDVHHDLRGIMDKENFVPQATPYLRSFVNSLQDIRDRVEKRQDSAKETADRCRRPALNYKVGDLVLVKSHELSNAAKGVSRKFMPKRDGPYTIKRRVSPTTFLLVDTTNVVIGKYHCNDLTPFIRPPAEEAPPNPLRPKRRRGRPRVTN